MKNFSIGSWLIIALCVLLAVTHHIIWAFVAYVVLKAWLVAIFIYYAIAAFVELVRFVKSV